MDQEVLWQPDHSTTLSSKQGRLLYSISSAPPSFPVRSAEGRCTTPRHSSWLSIRPSTGYRSQPYALPNPPPPGTPSILKVASSLTSTSRPESQLIPIGLNQLNRNKGAVVGASSSIPFLALLTYVEPTSHGGDPVGTWIRSHFPSSCSSTPTGKPWLWLCFMSCHIGWDIT